MAFQSVAESKTRRPGGRSARVRQAVFDATLAELAARGYRALSIESVADAAGVNKTTVYRNWPTKAALVLAAVEGRSEALIVTRVTGDDEADLIGFLRSVADNVTSPVGRALIMATMLEDDAQVQEIREQFWRDRFQATTAMVRSLRAFKADAQVDADAFIEQLVGPLYLRAFITGAPIDDAYVRSAARAALRMLSAAQPVGTSAQP